MTLIWSLGKNIEAFGDPEYIGISHYRRYLDLSKSTFDKNKIICNYEVTTYSLYQLYSIYHNIDDLNLFISIFIKHFPELRKNIMEYFSQSQMYMCNLFVMHREIFRHYFSFIEKCIKICIDEIRPQLNFDTRDKY